MALDKSDPFGHLPRPAMFAKMPVVPQPEKSVLVAPRKPSPPTVVPRLAKLVEAASKRGAVKGTSFHVRLQPVIVAKLEAWAKAHDAGSIPDAIRKILADKLNG